MVPIIKKIWSDEITELTDRLKRIISSDRANAKYFVFKCSQTLLENIKADDRAVGEIVDRSQGKPAYTLHFHTSSNDYVLHQISKNSIRVIKNNELLEEIRSYDLKEVIDSTNGDCFIDAPDNAHFVTPSGKHTTRFLRLSNALYSYNALDRISFWLQLYVARSSAVIIDTWPLSSIILRALQLLNSNIPFDCFPEHVKSNDIAAVSMLNKFARRIKDDGPVLVLVGISSSGEFFKAMPELFERSNISNSLHQLSIYGFRNTPDNVNLMSRLDIDIVWYEQADCNYCISDDRKTCYQIDSKYYYPRKYEEKPIRFAKHLLQDEDRSNKSKASAFIHKYGKKQGVLLVHKDDPNDGVTPRHHAFYIDVPILLSLDYFIEELNAVTHSIEKKSGMPDIVISPPHDAARLIQSHLRTRWPNTAFLLCHNLRMISKGDLEQFNNAKHICFVDDVFISGSRIEGYLRGLREELGSQSIPGLRVVSWFPLILRPPRDTDVVRIKDSLSGHESHWKNVLYYVHKVILPDWSSAGECPWCEEARVLDRFIGPLWDEPRWYKERNLHLKNVAQGIGVNPIFVEPFSEHKTLGAGSALGDEGLNEMQILFLLANGLQKLRYGSKPSLGKDDLLYRYVLFWETHPEDEKSGTFNRYSEPLIQSCFLRAVKLEEWSRTIWRNDSTILQKKIDAGNCNELIGETILFYLRHGGNWKMTKSNVDKAISIFNDEAVALLMEAVGEK